MDLQLTTMDKQFKVLGYYHEEKFSDCLRLIEEFSTEMRESSHFKVLKAACLVNLDLKLELAHRLLDEVLYVEDGNEYAHYAKGLAFMRQKQLKPAIENFNKAISLDKTGTMGKAQEMRDKALLMMKEAGDVYTKSPPDVSPVVNKNSLKVQLQAKMKTPPPNVKLKTCHICSKNFTKTFSLTRHMKLHTGERPHKCERCDFAFIQKSDLLRHEATHIDNFEFDCHDCDKKFKTKKNLQCHQISHMLERPFKCDFCEKTFKLKKFLRYHEKLHGHGKGEFICDLCPRSYSEKHHLESHIIVHLNAKKFGCRLCNTHYSTVERLSKHFRVFHGLGNSAV